MREMRKSIAFDLKERLVSNSKVDQSIKRASVSFQLASGTEAGEVVIENERLKSTLAILNQKLKVGQDTESTLRSKI
jgi:hypothetical protein